MGFALKWMQWIWGWAKANPDRVVGGGALLFLVIAGVVLLRPQTLKQAQETRPIGERPAASGLTEDELIDENKASVPAAEDQALNTLLGRVGEAEGNLLAARCQRWRINYFTHAEPKRISPREFIADQLKIQADLTMQVAPDDFPRQMERLAEQKALRMLWSDCRQTSFQVVTPATMGSVEDKTALISIAAQDLVKRNIERRAASENLRGRADRELEEATSGSRSAIPVINPVGGQQQ